MFHRTPPCSSCLKIIDSGQFFKTIDSAYSWHESCFKCSICSNQLSPQSFYITDHLSIQCGPCCQSETIKYCSECRRAIETTEASKVGEKYFHKSCLKCGSCDAPIIGEFATKEGENLCLKCIESTSAKCFRCKKPIVKEAFLIKAANQSWHQECLKCFVCKQEIEEEFVVYKDKIQHKECVDCDKE